MCHRALLGFTFDSSITASHVYDLFFSVMHYLVKSRWEFTMLVFTGLNGFCRQ